MTETHEGARREATRSRYDADRRAAQPARRKRVTGYRTDTPRHIKARYLLDAERRRAIASMGGQARADKYRAATRSTSFSRIRAALIAQEQQPHSDAQTPHPPIETPPARPESLHFSAEPATERRRSAPPPRPAPPPPSKNTVALTPQQKAAARATRAAASRPARRAAQRARERAERDAITKALRS